MESRRESISKHLIGEHTRAATRNAWTTSCFVTTYVNDRGPSRSPLGIYLYTRTYAYIYVYIYAHVYACVMHVLHPSLFPRRLCAWADRRNPFQEGISRVAIEGNVSRKPSG